MKRLFNLTEIAIISYVVITMAFIFFFKNELPNFIYHLLLRLIVIGVLGVTIFIQKKYDPSFFKHLRIFIPFLFLAFFYNETDLLNNVIFKTNLDPVFSTIELNIFHHQPSVEFALNFPYNIFAEAMYLGYFSYYLLIVGLPLYFCFAKREEITKKIIFVVIASFLLYYLIFILFPVAGPQFYFKDTTASLPQGFIFGEIMRIIQFYGEGETAAFPSSHVSICLILLWFTFNYAKKLLIFVLPITILLIMSTVYIRAHYLIDVLAAFLITPVFYKLFSGIYFRFSKY